MATECGSYRVASFTSEEMKPACELELLARVDLLALNREEAIEFAGGNLQEASEDHLLDACSKMALSLNLTMKILVSSGAAGAYLFDCGHSSKHKAVPMGALSTAGACDALLAGTIAGLAVGMPIAGVKDVVASGEKSIGSAIDLGLTLAAFSVTSPHTIHPEVTLESLLSFAEENGFAVPRGMAEIASTTGTNVGSQPG